MKKHAHWILGFWLAILTLWIIFSVDLHSFASGLFGGGGGSTFTGGAITTPITAADGSTTAPSYSFTGQTDEGFYRFSTGVGLANHSNGGIWAWVNSGNYYPLQDNAYSVGQSANRVSSVFLVNSVYGPTATPLTVTAGAQAATETLTFPVTREAETVAIQPQKVFFSVAAPSGVAAASSLMAGLSSGVTRITPQVTGNLYISCMGMEGNGSIAGITTLTLKYGSGNGPANQAAATGTSLSSAQGYVAETAAGKNAFALQGIATGLTLGTAYYIDILIGATTGTGTIYTVDCVAWEL